MPMPALPRYRHYKGAEYLLLCTATQEATGTEQMVYIQASSGKVFCRPRAEWEEMVSTPQGPQPRFHKVETDA